MRTTLIDGEELLSTEQMAQFLGVGPGWLYKRGAVVPPEARFRLGKRVVWSKAAMVAWVRSGCPTR